MPSSYHGHISDVIDLYLKASPKTVLDIGIGFGKWGVLFREYGDIFRGRFGQKDWKVKIDGVEIFEDYSNEIYTSVYSHVYFNSIEDFVKEAMLHQVSYNFIFAGDVIEHLTKEIALSLLKNLKTISQKLVISIPLTDRWPQGEVFGNKFETHLSVWEEKDLDPIFPNKKLYKNQAGKDIGLFYT